MSAAPRPGWYPDPAGTPELYRWWDGGGWTQAISESPRAPSPPTSVPAGPEDDLRRRGPSRIRSVIALLVCLALFVSATVGLGLAIWQDPPKVQRTDRMPGGSAGQDATLPAGGGALGWLDEGSRVATIGAASMTLPEHPYVLSPDPMRVPAVLEVFFLASAPVHQRYDGGRSWSAAVLLGRLSGPAAGTPDLHGAGMAAVQQLSTAFFSSQPTRLARISVADHSVEGHRGLRVTAEVHYDIPGLPSRYDLLSAIVVGLDDGSVVAAVSSVPDDADARVAALADRALGTLTIS